MATVDIWIDDTRRRRRRRRKWLIPLLAGLGVAIAIERTSVPRADATKSPAQLAPQKAARGGVAPPRLDTAIVVSSSTSATTSTSAATAAASTDMAPPAATPPAHLAVAPAAFDFRDVAPPRVAPAQMVTIRNDGGQPLAGVVAAVEGPFLATNGCSDALAAGERCTVAIVFAPKQPGRSSGALTIAAGEQHVRVVLRGSMRKPRDVPRVIAEQPPMVLPHPPAPTPTAASTLPLPPARTLCFEPAYIHFTSTGKQTITLTNPESVPVRVVAILPIGQQGQSVSGYEIDSGRCLRELKTGQQCRFTVHASQLALQRREMMQLTVYYDDPLTGGRRAAQFSTQCGR